MDLAIGKVVKTHGIKGELVVDLRTDDPAARFYPGATLRGTRRGEPEQTFTVVAAREHGGRLLLSVAGVADRTAAESLRGTTFVIDQSEVSSDDDPDGFYDHELIGLPVTTVAGEAVGTVSEVLHLPASDVLEVTTVSGPKVLVPFVADIVPTVTADGVTIDPPDGLLDL